MAIESSLDDPAIVRCEMPEKHFEPSRARDLVRNWLCSLNGKQRAKLLTIRMQILLLLAHQIMFKRAEEIWRKTGTLVRSAMAIGLHRDPTNSPYLTIFEAEQRRKL